MPDKFAFLIDDHASKVPGDFFRDPGGQDRADNLAVVETLLVAVEGEEIGEREGAADVHVHEDYRIRFTLLDLVPEVVKPTAGSKWLKFPQISNPNLKLLADFLQKAVNWLAS